ncbi:MAG: nucleotide exchange factor GrpE, partial [Dactylosporangium sp.]|nr:nucleotide exchange factor GrpE [Dactylosporangium sp.]
PDPTGPHPDDPDRETLITACIYVRDRITSRALGDRLATALTAAGVGILEPVGARFDPALHEAGGTVTTTDPARAGTIAAVESPGYTDRTGRLLRAPVVTVHRLSDPARGESR